MENYYLDVELPTDLKAKISEKEKFEGTQVHDTLESVIEEQQQKKLDGKKTDLLDNAKAVRGQKIQEETDEKFSEKLRKKKENAENNPKDQKNLIPTKCLCVHGHCEEGKPYCDQKKPCEAGWHGALCDAPDKNNERKKSSAASSGDRKMRAKVIEDEEEDDIFSVRRIDDDTYTETVTSASKNTGGKFGVVTATDDNSWDTRRVVDNATKNYGSNAEPVNLAHKDQNKQGWFSWMFWSFISLVQYFLIVVAALVALVCLKYCYE